MLDVWNKEWLLSSSLLVEQLLEVKQFYTNVVKVIPKYFLLPYSHKVEKGAANIAVEH